MASKQSSPCPLSLLEPTERATVNRELDATMRSCPHRFRHARERQAFLREQAAIVIARRPKQKATAVRT